jgi:cytochrome c oxidase assembly factor CtaG
MSAAAPGPAQLLGWQLDPVVLILLVAAGTLYGAGALRARGGWPAQRSAAFLAGLLALALALMSGIDAYSERLLSVHMAQHLLLMLAAPVLLLWGAPVRLALAAGPRSARRVISALLHRRVVRSLLHPALGLAVLAAVTLGTHLTPLYEVALRHPALHALEHAAYLWAGLLFLAPLLGSDPLPRRPSPLARFALLMAAMVVMAVPGALLAFTSTVRYPFYAAASRSLHVSALSDQHLAGAVMWIGGGLAIFTLAAIVAMQALLAEERRQLRRELYAADQPSRAPSAGPAAPRGMVPR